MNKYERLRETLQTVGAGKMKAYGNSMLPILKSGSLLTFEQATEYRKGDIVFCKVNGRYIDASAAADKNRSPKRISDCQ
jgi:phage repressor protein C with HTH and peptisase S24 domain